MKISKIADRANGEIKLAGIPDKETFKKWLNSLVQSIPAVKEVIIELAEEVGRNIIEDQQSPHSDSVKTRLDT